MAKQWQWSEQRGSYRAPDGTFRNGKQAIAAADQYLANKQLKTADGLFELLRSGQLSVRDAQLVGEREIAKAHLAMAMAAKGGRAQMTQADFGRVGGIVSGELVHWRDRCKELGNGQPLDGRVKQSFRAFIDKSRVTYIRVQQLEMQKRGIDEQRNVLEDRAHACSECPEITALGWQPVGSFSNPGERECRGNCRCFLQFRSSATGEVRE